MDNDRGSDYVTSSQIDKKVIYYSRIIVPKILDGTLTMQDWHDNDGSLLSSRYKALYPYLGIKNMPAVTPSYSPSFANNRDK